MPIRTAVILLVLVAGILWLGVLTQMNRNPPDLTNMVLFLLVWGAAIGCTSIPIAYGAVARVATLSARRRALNWSIRRGVLLGVLAMVLMGLRFARLLSPANAAILVLLTLSIEVLASVRRP